MSRNNWSRLFWLGITGLWILGSAPLSAADSQADADKNASLQRWQSLSPDQRKELLENYHLNLRRHTPYDPTR